jgi:hypothetical protein
MPHAGHHCCVSTDKSCEAAEASTARGQQSVTKTHEDLRSPTQEYMYGKHVEIEIEKTEEARKQEGVP